MRVSLLVLLLLGAGAPLQAQILDLRSGPEQVGLLELYTSEGCSSCPPADRWLTSLKQRPGLFSEFIPLAFHVDYWDYIGWQDPFADSSHSDRQRNYARHENLRNVYTPGFLYNGAEWRNFFGGNTDRFPAAEDAGILSLRLADGIVSLAFEPVGDGQRSYTGNVALLGFDLESAVAAGENRGRKLKHDFVVLAHRQTALAGDDTEFSGALPLPTSAVTAQRYALVAWVNDSRNPTPLQAVGGYLPR